MQSFEDVGVAPELVESLSAEGIECPTPLQEAAIPILRQGNNLVLAAGPGSGLLVAWSVGLLERIPPEGDAPRVVVLTASREAADRLAESVARLSTTTNHVVAALGSAWVLPERAHVLFGTPGEVLDAASTGRVSLAAVEALVVDQAQTIDALGGLGDVERVLDFIPPDAQRILSTLPVTPTVQDLVERHFRRALVVPTPAIDQPPSRGDVRFRVASGPREEAALAVINELLADDARHVLVFCRNEDRAADVGDYLTLHGFASGAPGDPAVPVWLAVDALQARASAKGVDGLLVVSCDAPADPDTLDRRHAISSRGVVIVLPREVAHLRHLGKRTGYGTIPFPPPKRPGTDAIDALRHLIETALAEEDTAPYLLALEPLFERHDPTEVAAAAVALLRRKAPLPPRPSTAAVRSSAAAQATATPAWAKLFVGVGERDGLKAGDLLGAITGETGVSGEAVGRIDIKESHTLVEVHDSVARKVIQAINGTTIKGRAVRADFDRPRKGGGPKRPTART